MSWGFGEPPSGGWKGRKEGRSGLSTFGWNDLPQRFYPEYLTWAGGFPRTLCDILIAVVYGKVYITVLRRSRSCSRPERAALDPWGARGWEPFRALYEDVELLKGIGDAW